jgi:hypothetical protein
VFDRQAKVPSAKECVVNIDEWKQLPTSPTVSLRHLDVARQLTVLQQRMTGSGDIARTTMLFVSLPVLWGRIARDSMRRGTARWAWVGPSTLVCAAPRGSRRGRLGQELAPAWHVARQRGATDLVEIFAAAERPGVNWDYYRSWSPFARDIDVGRLRAAAFYDPDAAALAAVRAMGGLAALGYDASRRVIDLRGPGQLAPLDVPSLSFFGLIRGFLPEQTLAAAALETATFQEGRQRYVAWTQERFEIDAVRFLGTIPVVLAGSTVVLDPLGRVVVLGRTADTDHEPRMREAIGSPLSARCTCRLGRWVEPVLRRAGQAPCASPHWLSQPAGPGHERIYEMACLHSRDRPTSADWLAAGWTAQRCEEDWWRQLAGELRVAAAKTGGHNIACVYGAEVGAIVSARPAVDALALAFGFAAGTQLTVYVPVANAAFLSDEPLAREDHPRAAFTEGTLEAALKNPARPLGPAVGYVDRITVQPAEPLTIRMRPLGLHPLPLASRHRAHDGGH